MDEDDFYVIFRTYWRLVKAFFRRLGFSEQDAEDLTQETFFRVFRSMKDYEDRDQFVTWLLTIARNVARSEWGRKGTQKRQGIEESYDEHPDDEEDDGGSGRVIASSDPSPDELAELKELHEWLDAAIQSLPKRQRQCLTLRLQGNSYKEIATLLKISPETVKQHLSAARKALPSILGCLIELRGSELCCCVKLWLERKTIEEIAKLRRISPEAVRRHLEEARKFLRDCLGFDLIGRGGWEHE